jgi:electron transport complex protein RnfG
MGPALASMLRSALILGAFGLAGTSLVAISHALTHDRIEANERAALLQRLHEVVPPETHDNDLFEDVIRVRSPELLGTGEPVPVYRARQGGQPVAAVLAPVAPDGYSGPIRLLVGVRHDGAVMGVRVVSHSETPGLGDQIEHGKSDWIEGFRGRSLSDPEPEGWAVERDGGAFDQLTGATITPRAVVRAVHDALRFFRDNRERLFEAPRAPAAADAAEALMPEERGARTEEAGDG